MLQTILLTGASEGTGLSAARILASKGADIIIVSRNNTAKLSQAIDAITKAAKWPDTQRFHAIPADVSEPGYAAGVVAAATAWNNGYPPEIVWCVAGLSYPMLWSEDDALRATRRTMEVNFFGSAEMSHAILRAWLRNPPAPEEKTARLSKHIIFTGSVLSVFSMAGYATYCPSKFALRGLIDVLAMEMRLHPDVSIEVHLVLPTAIQTAGFEVENKTKPQITKKLEESDKPQDPDTVARVAIASLEKGHHLITTSFIGELMRWGALSNSPRNNWLIDTLMGWIMPLILAFTMWNMNSEVSSWGRKKRAGSAQALSHKIAE